MKCNKCNAELEKNAMFCPNCGNKMKISENTSVFCVECGTINNANAVYCIQCGKKIRKKKNQKNSKKFKRNVLIGTIISVTLILAILAENLFFKEFSNKEGYCLYTKDDRLYSVSEKRQESVAYEGKMIWLQNGDIHISPNMKYLCYLDEENRLYTAELGKENVENIRIDKNIYSFTMLNDQVVYKDANNGLYISNMKGEKEKIASNVEEYYLDTEGNYVAWTTIYKMDDSKTYYNLYYRDLKLSHEKKKIAEGVLVNAVSDDLKKICLQDEENTLYVIDNFGSLKTIDKNVYQVYVHDNINYSKVLLDKIFYTKVSEKEVALHDIMENDIGVDETEVEESVSYEAIDLYYYNGKSVSLVEENVYDIVGRDAKGIVYRKGDIANMEKVNFSEVWYSDNEELRQVCEKHFQKTLRSTLYVGGKKIPLEKPIDYMCLNTETGISYGIVTEYCEDLSTGMFDWDGELYRFDSNQKASGKMELVDEDVYFIEKVDKGNVYYAKNMEGEKVSLFVNGELIDEDMYEGTLKIMGRNVYYLEGNTGDIKKYDGKKTSIIADDAIGGWNIIDENRIYYITNYNYEYQTGDLMFYDGKKSKLIEEDVTGIVGTDYLENEYLENEG